MTQALDTYQSGDAKFTRQYGKPSARGQLLSRIRSDRIAVHFRRLLGLLILLRRSPSGNDRKHNAPPIPASVLKQSRGRFVKTYRATDVPRIEQQRTRVSDSARGALGHVISALSHSHSRTISHGSTCQISDAYSRMVRSDENFPARATFRMAFRIHPLRSLYAASTRSCVWM